MKLPSELELSYLDEDIARLRRRIAAKERADAEGRITDRKLWYAALMYLRGRLDSLVEHRRVLLAEMVAAEDALERGAS